MKFWLIFVFKAVPRLMWFSLSSWRPGFKDGQFVWGFLDSNVAAGQVLVIVLRFPPCSSSVHHSRIQLNKMTRLENIKQYNLPSDKREQQTEKYSNVLFSRLCSAMLISSGIPWSSICISNMTGMLVKTDYIRLLYFMTLLFNP